MDPELGVLPVGDVLIEDGVIAAVAPSLGEPDAEVIDASGHLVAPGLIDTHRHSPRRPSCARSARTGP